MTALKLGEPKITFCWGENYDAFRKEAQPLFERHWREVGSHRDTLHLNPNHDRYVFMQKSGILHLLTVRDRGVLVGYFGVCIIEHPRDRDALLGVDDFIYSIPEYRRYMVGWKMLKEGIRHLDEAGCHLIAFREKTRRKNGGYLKRLGFHPMELVSTLVLRKPHE